MIILYTKSIMFSRGTELRCTLWGVYAQQFSDFLNKCDDHGKIIVVVQLAMTKIWDGNVAVTLFFFTLQQKLAFYVYRLTSILISLSLHAQQKCAFRMDFMAPSCFSLMGTKLLTLLNFQKWRLLG